MKLGQAIKIARQNKNLLQHELASYCGVTNAAISQIEGDKRDPQLKTLVQLLRVLNLRFEDLFKINPIAICPMCKQELKQHD